MMELLISSLVRNYFLPSVILAIILQILSERVLDTSNVSNAFFRFFLNLFVFAQKRFGCFEGKKTGAACLLHAVPVLVF